MTRLFALPAHELRALIARQELGAEELTRAYIDRIERTAGRLNAVAQLAPVALQQARALDAAAESADLPLRGLPVLVKDNIDVCGMRTSAGSFALLDNIARQDAPVIAALRRRGAVILGKTNMTELANYTTQGMPNGFSSRGGQVVHAYIPGLDPSGSSSGSGVAMSAGLCAAAVGTDTSFSVVGCASVHGIVGLKPPHGALPTRGIVPISHTLDSAGPMTRDMTDALMMYSAMRSEPLPAVSPIAPERLRIAVNSAGRDRVSAEQLSRYDALLDALRGTGAHVGEVDHPYSRSMSAIMRCEFERDMDEYLSGSSAGIRSLRDMADMYEAEPIMRPYGITLLHAALESGGMTSGEYAAAMAERARLTEALRPELDAYDAILMTGPTNIMHMLGLPSLTLPICMGDDGAPRGAILYGLDEHRLWAAALTIERYCQPIAPPEL